MAGISELEKKALKLIEESSDGILQSDLWKMMNLDSREGSRLVLRLVKKGLVKREQVIVNGRRTYRLTIAKTTSEPVSVKIDISTILDIPCATCPFINDCGPRNFHDPRLCPLLDRWLRAKIRARSHEREISRTTSI